MTDAVPPRQPPLARAAILATLLVAVDALWLGQGFYSLLVGAGVLLVGLPRALLPKFRPVRKQRLRNVAIYVCAVLLVWALNIVNDRHARSRAEELIAAVRAFEEKNQRYPKSLQELVPAHLEQVPLARYTLAFNNFTYLPSADDPALLYVSLPPFGRPVYSFARSEWSYLD